MKDLLARVVEDFGCLVAVYGSTTEPIQLGQPIRFEHYAFHFENGSLTVTVDVADDTVALVDGDASLSNRTLLTEAPPWSGAVGRGVLWTWLLTNQSGFVDGFQIELGLLHG